MALGLGASALVVVTVLRPSVFLTGQMAVPAASHDQRYDVNLAVRPTPIPAPLPSSYTITEGDTLFDIAVDFDTSVEALALANNLEDLNLLRLGLELVVPPPGSARQPTDPALTLTQVAASYGLDPAVLAAYNGIAPDLVDEQIAREALLFPLGMRPLAMAAGADTFDALLEASIPFGAERPLEPFVYRVRPGDTLLDVAWRLGIDLDTIINNNSSSLVDADRIRIGDELLVLPISGLLYRVEEDDTLVGIAEKFGLDLSPILEFNSLNAESLIELGMDIILPGAGPVYAAFTPGIPRIAVPYRSQLDGTPWAGANCGPTTLGMGLASLGIHLSSTELRRQVLGAQGIWGNNVGTLLDALARVASNNGARTVGLLDGNRIARWTLDDVRDQLRAGRPVIAQVRFRALPGRAGVRYFGDHYIILTGLSGESFLYNDPMDSDGPGADRVLTAAQLQAAMNAGDQRYAYGAFALAR